MNENRVSRIGGCWKVMDQGIWGGRVEAQVNLNDDDDEDDLDDYDDIIIK